MLPHYSPLKVAETFSLLSGLCPGRVDLGLGRAPGSDQRTAFALQRDRRQQSPNDFPSQLAELLGYLEDDLPAGHVFADLAKTLPGAPEVPDVWLLGSSPDSAAWAAEAGLPYCFADFINSDGAAIADQYRRAFRPGVRADKPYTMVALWSVCAETDAEAERLALSSRMMLAHLLTGVLIPVPSPDKAAAWLAANPGAAAAPRPPDDRRIAGHRPRRDRGSGRRIRRRRSDAGQHRPRPRRAGAELRTGRRRVRGAAAGGVGMRGRAGV